MSDFAELHARLQKRPSFPDKEEMRRARESEYVKNSRLARARDHFHCRICGSMFNLETHHLTPRSLVGKALRNALSNLITLCQECHEQVTRHVIKLYPLDAEHGANGLVRVEKFDKDVKDYIVAMEAA